MGRALIDEAADWKTGRFQISEAPNPHSLLYEHVKTIVTLSIAFLGFSVGFAEKLAEVASFPNGSTMLAAVWGLLVASIILVLLAAVNLHRYLLLPPDPPDPRALEKYKGFHNRCALEVGLAGFCLTVAAGIFAVFGAFVLLYSVQDVDASAAAQKATSTLSKAPGLAGSPLQVESITWEEAEKHYKILFSTGKPNDRYVVLVRKTDGEAISYSRQETTSNVLSQKEILPMSFSARDVQRRLTYSGYYSGRIDGVMGIQTVNAIRRFQLAYELPVTGRLDKETLEKLGMLTQKP